MENKRFVLAVFYPSNAYTDTFIMPQKQTDLTKEGHKHENLKKL